MRYEVRLSSRLVGAIHVALDRPHPFAFERVGFLFCKYARAAELELLLGWAYEPVDDDDYLQSESFGALIGARGIRQAMQRAYASKGPVIHVHRHEHGGSPSFSETDERTNAELVPAFWNVARGIQHGALVLSLDRAYCHVWHPTRRIPVAASVRTVGCHTRELT